MIVTSKLIEPSLYRFLHSKLTHSSHLKLSPQHAHTELKWILTHIVTPWPSSPPQKRYTSPTPTRNIPPLSPSQTTNLIQYIDQRSRGIPLAYVLGTQPFAGLDIIVKPPILIPRWETEEWTLRVKDLLVDRIQHFHKQDAKVNPENQTRLVSEEFGDQRFSNFQNQPLRILDLCTGSGCIALSLLHHLQPYTPTEIHAIDVNPLSKLLFHENLHKLFPLTTHPSAKFMLCDIFNIKSDLDVDRIGLLKNGYDVIVSNPPYVSTSEFELSGHVSDDVKKYEDRRALVAGEEGTEFHEKILKLSGMLLKNQDIHPAFQLGQRRKDKVKVPRIVMEIGWNDELAVGQRQGELLRRKAKELNRERDFEIWQDLSGKDRAVALY
ncbi:S-adenosyl-L-methionine-dependent methyltransferase [Paraphysoderma sedebokerense]|nr:S-adenosyl-L-methionine-dependent methyltransferase [Paraphysoderma sedebokerense]